MDPVILLKGLLWEKAETRHSELELSFSLWRGQVGKKDPQVPAETVRGISTHKPDWPHLNLGFGEGKESAAYPDEANCDRSEAFGLNYRRFNFQKYYKKQQSLETLLKL